MAATHKVINVPLADGATASSVIDTQGMRVAALEIPSGLTATAITFEGGFTQDGSFYPVYDDAGNQYSMTVASSRFVAVDSVSAVTVARYIKLIPGTTQSGAITLRLHLRL